MWDVVSGVLDQSASIIEELLSYTGAVEAIRTVCIWCCLDDCLQLKIIIQLELSVMFCRHDNNVVL